MKGLYIHIPYCLQRCYYCDFATVLMDNSVGPDAYVSLLQKEIQLKAPFIRTSPLTSIYFGGGTPSLLSTAQLKEVIDTLDSCGIAVSENCEFTLEANPGTFDEDKLRSLKELGFNRISLGAQTLSDTQLDKVNRKHSVRETLESMALLRKSKLPYSVDILFGLPNQTLADVRFDLEGLLEYEPHHFSAYNLTLTEGHFLNKGRPENNVEAEMYEAIWNCLKENGYSRYEVSNYSKPGYESKHNQLYWTWKEYFGIGMSAHSLSSKGERGTRYWNPRNILEYKNFVESIGELGEAWSFLPQQNVEPLKLYQFLTDLFHTRLRLLEGFHLNELEKLPERILPKIDIRLSKLVDRGLLAFNNERYSLSTQGLLVPNLVFEELTFLEGDV